MAPSEKKAMREMRRRHRNEDLLECAMSANHRGVAKLLEERADVDYQDRAGYTALSEAASAGHAIVVGTLLRSFADVDKPAQDGRTALHRACFQNWMPVVKLLLETGADTEVKDEDGARALELARTGAMREALTVFDREKAREAAEERRKRRAELPQHVDEDEDEEEEQVPPKAEETKPEFEPPPRAMADRREKEAKAKAEKAALRAEREKKYQEALAEIQAQCAQEGGGDESGSLANLPPPLVARVRVVAAGEERLNGNYRVAYVAKERAEFMHEDDESCQIVWTEYQNEWRMLVGDYKMGSTLYRHTYKPNIKADERLGIPREGWQPWFGKKPAPQVEFLPDFGTPEYEEAVAAAVAAAASLVPEVEESTRPEEAGVVQDGGAPGDDALVTEVDESARALEWLEEEAGEVPEVPAQWDAMQAAKAAAQDLFRSGSVGDARQATTAALRAARRLLRQVEDPGPDDEIALGSRLPAADEIEKFIGVLHSNRSLLLLQQIQSGSEDVLKFGADAAWNLVARDADKALVADPSNFKASFRRARAFFELGDLESALSDANRVVDHYVRNSSTPNPEAAALRDRILEATQKERRKWGQKAPSRWNRGTSEPLITEIGVAGTKPASIEEPSVAFLGRRPAATAAAGPRQVPAAAGRGPPAPRTGGDVEKALVSTLKGDAALRSAYVKEHLSEEAVRKFFKRAPPGPDLLATLVRALADLAEAGDAALAERLLQALSDAPSAKVQAAMFDADEQASLKRLLGRVGQEAAAKWED